MYRNVSVPCSLPAFACALQVQDLLKGESDEDGKGGRALAVQDINAPAEYVWDRILDFGTYNTMVSGVGVFFSSVKLFFGCPWSGCTSQRAEFYRKADRDIYTYITYGTRVFVPICFVFGHLLVVGFLTIDGAVPGT